MGDGDKQAGAIASFWRVAGYLWVLSLAGALLILPYASSLEAKALSAAAARLHVGLPVILLVSFVQSAILLAVAVGAGLWASRRVGLGTPLLNALVSKSPFPKNWVGTLFVAFALGLACGVGLLLLDYLVFTGDASVATLIKNGMNAMRPAHRWQGLLASFYGAFDEEILMRLGLLSLLALGLRTCARWLGACRETPLPSGVFWVANLATAVLFGIGHLPATSALAPLSAMIVLRAITLNGAAGILFGYLFRRFGLEWAMASHFGTDLVLHVVAG
jgi:hypothetical protein